MPIGTSTGEAYEDEFDMLAGRTIPQGEPTARITVSKKAPKAEQVNDLYVDEFDDERSTANDSIIDENFGDYVKDKSMALSDRQADLLGRYIGFRSGEKMSDEELKEVRPLLDEVESLTKKLPSSKESNGVINFYNWPGLLLDRILKDRVRKGIRTSEAEATDFSAQSKLPITSGKPQTQGFESKEQAWEELKTALSQTWPAQMAKDMWAAFTLAGRVAKGEVDPTHPDTIKEAANFGLNIGMSGLATAGLKPGVGMFGGRMSKDAVDMAERLEKQKVEPKAIKVLTGLERGAEGMWRKEIDDFEATIPREIHFENTPIKDDAGKVIREYRNTTLEEILEHPALYKAYPELKGTPVILDEGLENKKAWGYYDSGLDIIVLNPKLLLNKEQLKFVLLHEAQHSIQYKEGFTIGTESQIPKDLKEAIQGKWIRERSKEVLQNIVKLGKAGDERAQEYAKALIKATKDAPYWSIAGEVEARNVSNRSGMTWRQRRESLASSTEDVPRKAQVIMDPKENKITGLGSVYSKAVPETIVSAAIKVGDDVYTGIHHGEAVLKAEKKLGKELDSSIESDLAGFVTSTGRYVDRKEAMEIAKKAEQVPKDTSFTKLVAEDLSDFRYTPKPPGDPKIKF